MYKLPVNIFSLKHADHQFKSSSFKSLCENYASKAVLRSDIIYSACYIRVFVINTRNKKIKHFVVTESTKSIHQS